MLGCIGVLDSAQTHNELPLHAMLQLSAPKHDGQHTSNCILGEPLLPAGERAETQTTVLPEQTWCEVKSSMSRRSETWEPIGSLRWIWRSIELSASCNATRMSIRVVSMRGRT
jgi:hypothetical protein